MRKTYSLYEAKAKFSELIRQVRERGTSFTVSYHGEPVAEIRPLESEPAKTIEQRLKMLEERGVLSRGRGVPRFRRIARRPGALRRFLEERD
jgi:prevent-host-death family protein